MAKVFPWSFPNSIFSLIRASIHSRYPNNWRLNVSDVRRSDGGLYVCEISSFPPRVLLTRLRVLGEERGESH